MILDDSRESAGRSAHVDRILLDAAWTLPCYCNHSLSPGVAMTRAVVVIHGIYRNPLDHFNSIVGVAMASGVIDDILVVAPHFQTDQDERADHDAYWADSGRASWKDGGEAILPTELSSFTAMDSILATLADKDQFPQLSSITLVGHSAGGQFVQRYAASGRAPNTLTGMTIRYVTANPSSYLYLNSHRPTERELSTCPEYDDYKYGLKNPSKYFADLTNEQIRRQYVNRRVTYLLGSADVVRDSDLEMNCAADAQGQNRFQRGQLYYSAIQAHFPTARHRLVIVPGVGHDHDAMYNSAEGKQAIFGEW